jgi:hypothetical protein
MVPASLFTVRKSTAAAEPPSWGNMCSMMIGIKAGEMIRDQHPCPEQRRVDAGARSGLAIISPPPKQKYSRQVQQLQEIFP